jgi:hypothetical protein
MGHQPQESTDMKTKTCSGVIALAITTLLAGAASAQTQTGAPAARHARLDTDGDGKISQAEFVQARTERLTALDADHDGSLTPAELRARVQAVRAERTNARFDRLDTDKNGEISRAEFDAARTPRTGGEAGRAHHRMDHRAGRRIAARGPVAIADVQTRATVTFARLDTDHDAFLTPAELRAGRVERMARLHERQADRRARHMSHPMAPATTPASPPAPASE